jgi:hypothetical protein
LEDLAFKQPVGFPELTPRHRDYTVLDVKRAKAHGAADVIE